MFRPYVCLDHTTGSVHVYLYAASRVYSNVLIISLVLSQSVRFRSAIVL